MEGDGRNDGRGREVGVPKGEERVASHFLK